MRKKLQTVDTVHTHTHTHTHTWYFKCILFILFIIIIIINLVINFLKSISIEYLSNISIVNFSIDDTIIIFDDLTQNESDYNSIFENETLSFLKELHEKYGAKFTMYVFFEFSGKSLENATTKFKNEFEENSDWLMFGFHAYNNSRNYYTLDSESFLNDYLVTIDRLESIVGEKSISSCIRLEKFYLGEENAKVLAENGITSLLGADTIDRTNYFLTEEENYYLFENDYLYDEETSLNIYNTDLRIENMNILIYNEDCLQDNKLVVFTHEWQLNFINKIKIKILLELLNKCDVEYSFLE